MVSEIICMSEEIGQNRRFRTNILWIMEALLVGIRRLFFGGGRPLSQQPMQVLCRLNEDELQDFHLQ